MLFATNFFEQPIGVHDEKVCIFGCVFLSIVISIFIICLIDKLNLKNYNYNTYRNIDDNPNISSFYIKGQSICEGNFDNKKTLTLDEIPVKPLFSGPVEFGLLPMAFGDEYIISFSGGIETYSITGCSY